MTKYTSLFKNEAVAASPAWPSSTGSAFAQQSGGHSTSAPSGGGFQSFSPRSRVGSGHATSASAYGGFYGSPMDSSDNSMHSITLPQRNSNFAPSPWSGDVSAMGMACGPSSAGLPSGSGGQRTAGHVKIGRRPAHLPKVLKFSDKTLPPGWIRKLKQRKHGKQAGRWDVYIYREVQLNFTSEIKRFHMLFERCPTKNGKRSIKQHIKILQFPE